MTQQTHPRRNPFNESFTPIEGASQMEPIYEPMKRTLVALREAFDRAARRHGPINVERLVAPLELPDRQITVEGWRSFVVKHGSESKEEWQQWLVSSDISTLVRFWGDPTGLETFQRLAESSYLAVAEFMPALPQLAGYQGWIEYVLLNFGSARPTPLLRSSTRFWNFATPEPSADEIDILENDWAKTADGNFCFPIHPFGDSLIHDLFTSSMAAIDQLLEPESILIVGDVTEELLESGDGLPAVELQQWIDLDVAGEKVRPELPKDDDNASAEGRPAVQTNEITVAPTQAKECFFKRTKNGWMIQFAVEDISEGPEYFADREGFADWNLLLENPGKKFEALELSPDERPEVGKPGKAQDDEGLARLRKVLLDLKDDLEIAETTGNPEKAGELTNRIADVQSQIYRDTNRFGRPYDLGQASRPERARKRVGARLRRTLVRMHDPMPECTIFLEKTLGASGTSFAYEPARQPLGQHVHWQF